MQTTHLCINKVCLKLLSNVKKKYLVKTKHIIINNIKLINKISYLIIHNKGLFCS